VGPRAYSAAAIASIRRAYRKSERDPLIGNLSEDEFAKPRKRLVVLVEEESKQISGQATAVGVGTGSSNPNVWRSGSLRAKEICPDPRHRDLVKLLAGRGIPQEHIRQLIRNPQTGRGRCPWRFCAGAGKRDRPGRGNMRKHEIPAAIGKGQDEAGRAHRVDCRLGGRRSLGRSQVFSGFHGE
jgi:hypothetical protein